MIFMDKIQELKGTNDFVEMNHILSWLVENENYCKYLINESNCRKWIKWLNNEEKPFPCVCPIKERDCVFIELFYELKKITKQKSNPEFYTSDLIELVLITQNEPYEKIKFLIQINK